MGVAATLLELSEWTLHICIDGVRSVRISAKGNFFNLKNRIGTKEADTT